jgi:hypothetical protein
MAHKIDAQIAAAEGWRNPHEPHFLRAAIAAQLGQPDRVMVLLRQAFLLGMPYSFWLHRIWYFEPLWHLQGWKDLMSPKW